MIELLVVISIIALLIALLLPALQMARGAMQDAKCASNQRQILTAMQNYVVDHDKLPRLSRARTKYDARPPFNDDDDLDGAPYIHAPVIHAVNAPASQGQNKFVNFGELWDKDLLSNIQAFYCPTQTHPELSFQTELNPWPPGLAELIAGNAEFKFWNDTFASYARRLGLSYVKFDNLTPDKAIMADANMFPSYARTHHNANGFNTGYVDGSVKFDRDHWFYDDSNAETSNHIANVRHCLEAFERLDR